MTRVPIFSPSLCGGRADDRENLVCNERREEQKVIGMPILKVEFKQETIKSI